MLRPRPQRWPREAHTMPTGPSLYDVLLGHIDGTPLGAYDDKTL